MRLAVLVLVLAGCDGIWDLDPILLRDARTSGDAVDGRSIDAAPGCVLEEFNDSALSGKWQTFNEDPERFRVAVQNGRLEIELPDSSAVNAQAGLRSVSSSLVLDNHYVEVVASAPAAVSENIECYFEVGVNDLNRYTIGVKNGMLIFASRLNDVYVEQDHVNYDRTAHRVWRISDGPDVGQVTFMAGPGGGAVARQLSITKQVRLNADRIGLVAGTQSGGAPAPGTAIFDDLAICPNP